MAKRAYCEQYAKCIQNPWTDLVFSVKWQNYFSRKSSKISLRHFIDEIIFIRASKSQYSELLSEYVLAEKLGKGSFGLGECYPYYKDCSLSIFRSLTTSTQYRYVEFVRILNVIFTVYTFYSTTSKYHEPEGAFSNGDNTINNVNIMSEERYTM